MRKPSLYPQDFSILLEKQEKASIRQLENKEALRTADEIGRRKKVAVSESSSKSSCRSWAFELLIFQSESLGPQRRLAQSPRTKEIPCNWMPILEGIP